VLLIVEVGVWRDVKVVGVGDVVRGLFARALVWDDVNSHCGAWTHARPIAARL
jgi:hypothetical protein